MEYQEDLSAEYLRQCVLAIIGQDQNDLIA